MRKILTHLIETSDIDKVMALQSLSYRDDLLESRDVFEIMRDVYSKGAVAVIVDNEFAGYIFFHKYKKGNVKPLNSLLKLNGNENCMFLHDICVHPDFRGLGLTKLLLKEFDKETESEHLGYQALIAVQNSEEFWKKCGFKIANIVKYGNKMAYYMIKILT